MDSFDRSSLIMCSLGMRIYTHTRGEDPFRSGVEGSCG